MRTGVAMTQASVWFDGEVSADSALSPVTADDIQALRDFLRIVVLATVLPETHQVRLFEETGQLHSEVAWSRPLGLRLRR